MKSKTEFKATMLCLKYIPVVMFLLMWLYMICAVFQITLPFSSTIAGCSILPAILIFSLSSVFQFCWVHKVLTIYSFVADLLINLNKYVGLGDTVFFLKILMMLIGLFIFFVLVFKAKTLRTACPKLKKQK